MKKTIDVTAADVAKAFEKDPAPDHKKFSAKKFVAAGASSETIAAAARITINSIDWDHQHEWEDVPQRSSMSYQDQVCTICGIKQMQAAAPAPIEKEPLPPEPRWIREGFPVKSAAAPMRHSKPGITGGALSVSAPILKEDDTITIFGTVNGPMSVKYSDIKKELDKRLGLDVFTNNMMKGGRS